MVWSCETIQDSNSATKTKTVTTKTETKTKTLTLKTKTKTETVKILSQDCLETRQCLETSHHWVLSRLELHDQLHARTPRLSPHPFRPAAMSGIL